MHTLTQHTLTPEYEAIARAAATRQELDDLDAWPLRLPFMPLEDLLEDGMKMSRCVADMNALIAEEMFADDPDLNVLVKAIKAEYLTGRACHMIADELERRRTGIAPRARTMN